MTGTIGYQNLPAFEDDKNADKNNDQNQCCAGYGDFYDEQPMSYKIKHLEYQARVNTSHF